MLILRTDARDSNIYSQFVAAVFGKDETCRPVFQFMNDVHYYLAHNFESTFRSYKFTNEASCLLISGM